MTGRRLIRFIARWALVAMLFAQGALVANACLRLDASPQAAFSGAQMDGCDMGIDKPNPNACLLGYLDQSDQSASQPTVSPVSAYVIATQAVQLPAARAVTHFARTPPGCAPPIPIRYCTLLI